MGEPERVSTNSKFVMSGCGSCGIVTCCHVAHLKANVLMVSRVKNCMMTLSTVAVTVAFNLNALLQWLDLLKCIVYFFIFVYYGS